MRKFLLISLLTVCVLSASGQFFLPKLHLAQAPFGQFGIAIEKVWDRQFSIQLDAQAMIPNGGQNFITRNFLSKEELKNSILNGYSGTLEFRVYTRRGRNEAVKVYGGPFIRYSRYDMRTEYETDSLRRDLTASLTNMSGGIQVGVQYIINNRISIDWTIIGLGYARNRLEGKVVTEETSDRPIGRIEDDLSSIPLIGPRIGLNENDAGELVFLNDYGTIAVRIALTIGLVF